MNGKAFSVLVEDYNIGQADGHEGLMTQKNYLTHVCMKTLIKEKDLHLLQGLHIGLPVGWHMTPENDIKMLDQTVQPFKSLKNKT